jgi:hypothetical protein
MALNVLVSADSRNLGLNAAFDILNSGRLRIYDGTQPATADTALSGNTLLADLAMGATAFAAASAGSKTANAITNDSSADATGTASWHSLLNSSNVRKIDGTVGTGTHDLVVNTVSIVAAAVVSCSSYVISQAA